MLPACSMRQDMPPWYPDYLNGAAVKNTLHPVQNPLRWKLFIPAIVWFLIVLVLLCIPGKDMPETRFSFRDADKLVHFFMFGMMAYLFCRPFLLSNTYSGSGKNFIYLLIVLAVSLWGLSTEFIQKYYVPHRDFELLDWLADSLGAFGAYLIIPKNR